MGLSPFHALSRKDGMTKCEAVRINTQSEKGNWSVSQPNYNSCGNTSTTEQIQLSDVKEETCSRVFFR